MMFANSPVEPMIFDGAKIFVKRDDLLHSQFSGNKARKFAYFLDHQFPNINNIIGYGSAQANSLYSMAALAKLRGWQLDFYVDHIAAFLKQKPTGNLRAALELDANVIDLNKVENRHGLSSHEFIEQQVLPVAKNTIFIPEGGRCHYAEYGINQLAQEIAIWKDEHHIGPIKVFLPSGTGTTGLYLNKYFIQHNLDISIFTCAVVGGSDYLRQQLAMLESNSQFYPTIIDLPKKYCFGKLYLECYQMWLELNSSKIPFELIYDPLGFLALRQYLSSSNNQSATIMYLHQGGLLGNDSMLPRYQRKYSNRLFGKVKN